MEGSPEDHGADTPEEGERLKINSIIIPADNEVALQQGQIDTSDLPNYQAITGGPIEHVELTDPPASMYVNEEGKLLHLPMNRRATLLLWMHNPAFRYEDFVAGDALLVGPGDDNGYDTNVPEDLAHLLFSATRFRTEVQVHGEDGWHGNDQRFNNWVAAYSHVLELGHRWTSVKDVRVIPEA